MILLDSIYVYIAGSRVLGASRLVGYCESLISRTSVVYIVRSSLHIALESQSHRRNRYIDCETINKMSIILSQFLNHLAYLLVCLNLCLVCDSTALSNHSSTFKDAALIDAVKCCAPGEHLIITEVSSLRCVTSTYALYEIVAANISTFAQSGKCDGRLDCVEVVQDVNDVDAWQLQRVSGEKCKTERIQQFDYYPKCCPQSFAYDSQTHRCTELQSELNRSRDKSAEDVDYLQVRKIGLSACPVNNFAVVDFESNFEVKGDEKQLRLVSGETFNYGDYCIDRKNDMDVQSYIVRACLKIEYACVRNKRRCLWKCCPDGEIYVIQNYTRRCMPRNNAGINITEMPNNIIENKNDYNFGIIYSNLKLGFVQFKPPSSMGFKINSYGGTEAKMDYVMRYFDVNKMTYCIDQLEKGSTLKQNVYMFHLRVDNTVEIFKGIVLFVSVFFAFLTFICYAILPEIRNVYGKCIMMECLTLIMGSFLLGYTKLFPAWAYKCCTAFGYGIIFAFLGLFAWLNVICVDMWLTFGVVKRFKVKDKKSELKKFILYSTYGFGIPTIIVSLMIIAQKTDFLPDSFTPKIGSKRCYFDNETTLDHITYFLIPMTIMQLINVILFAKTIIYCIKVKNEMQRMRDDSLNEKSKRLHSFKADKEKLILLLKLFLIMGIPWLFEVLSSFVLFKSIWALSVIEIVLDTVNCAKGITIFIVFILKQNVLNLLSLKFRLRQPPPRRSTELTSLTMTTTTH